MEIGSWQMQAGIVEQFLPGGDGKGISFLTCMVMERYGAASNRLMSFGQTNCQQ